MKAPATLDEFYRTFPSERRCWVALRRLRWPDGFRCPRCEERKAHRLRARGLWQCAGCRYQVSLTAGTHFHGTPALARRASRASAYPRDLPDPSLSDVCTPTYATYPPCRGDPRGILQDSYSDRRRFPANNPYQPLARRTPYVK
jgi:ribosomal protein L37AE/L43A